MAFQTPLTIAETINNIDTKKYVLPSIQREFVWGTQQITKLFDSLMRGYPINSFLFWKVSKENINEFIFYEFLNEYHQIKSRHNKKAFLSNNEDITAILDGQQRLTSLYIGLKGSYASKLSYKRWDNEQAYPVKKLYLNLLKSCDDYEFEYDFKFLTDEEAKLNDGEHHWFLVGEILKYNDIGNLNTYLIDNDLYFNQEKDKLKFANNVLFKLYDVIKNKPIISYYLEQSTELDKVLNIFIRVNSGGTTLSYSDLLLSFATAQWQTKDAREEIISFVDDINRIGRGFDVNKDFVLKAALVLSDFNDISFKVDNFNKTNMLKIEQNWADITKAIRSAMKLISSYGFNRDNITSNNLIIPIAYYLKHIDIPENFETSTVKASDRLKIKKWFTKSLLKRVFSFMPDGVLKPVRDIIKKNVSSEFPLDDITNHFKGTNRTIVFTEDDISNLLEIKYGQGNTLVIMSILYPWADLRNNFHIDHIHPKSNFTESKLLKLRINENDISFYLEKYNYLGNLQLLEAIPNIEKNNKPFKEWLEATVQDNSIDIYKDKHCIPKNVGLELLDFVEFFEKREELLIKQLENELL